jgi:hypothetical protein
VHGVNVKDSGWQPGWTQAIEIGFKHAGDQVLTTKDLTTLDCDQYPVILGPKAVTTAPVPWGKTMRAGRIAA